jgi:hypothetical protein
MLVDGRIINTLVLIRDQRVLLVMRKVLHCFLPHTSNNNNYNTNQIIRLLNWTLFLSPKLKPDKQSMKPERGTNTVTNHHLKA